MIEEKTWEALWEFVCIGHPLHERKGKMKMTASSEENAKHQVRLNVSTELFESETWYRYVQVKLKELQY